MVHQLPTCTTGPRPKLGSQPRATEKTRISRIPSRNVGSETPTRLTIMNRRDSTLVAVDTGVNTHRNADRERQHRRRDRQLQRRRQPLGDQAGRPAAPVGS